MFDTLKDPFGHADPTSPGNGPVGAIAETQEQARRTTTAGSPFDGLDPRDRSALITPATLKSPIVRRWAGYAPLAPQTPEAVPTATAADPSRYEVLGGWYVPADWDLKDLGRAALANANRANTNGANQNEVNASRSSASSVGESAKPIGARTGVDRQRPEGGRNQQGQLQTIRKTRRSAASASTGKTGAPAISVAAPIATAKATAGGPRLRPRVTATAGGASQHSTDTQGVFGVKTGTPAPSAKPRKKPSKAAWREAERHRQAKARQKPTVTADRVTGQSASWAPPFWRLLGAQALNAREEIKRASIRAEERFGDVHDAHNTLVVRSAHEQDAKVLGQTEQATVNSAVRATRKYQASQSRNAKETDDAKTAAAWRNQHQTFTREAVHARAKAEQAHLRGDTVDADHFERIADDFHTAATATLADAKEAGVDPQTMTAADGPGGGGGAGPNGKRDGSSSRDSEHSAVDDDPTTELSAGSARGTHVKRARISKINDLKQRLHVRDPQALITAVADLKTALKEAGDDQQSRANALSVFRQRLKDIGAGVHATNTLLMLARTPDFAKGAATPGDIVFHALTGSTPDDAGEKAYQEQRTHTAEAERKAESEASAEQLAAKKREATKRFIPYAADLKNPARRPAAIRAGFSVFRETGAMPEALAAYLVSSVHTPAAETLAVSTGHPFVPGNRGDDEATLLAARLAMRLRQDRPELWSQLPEKIRHKSLALKRAFAERHMNLHNAAIEPSTLRALMRRADGILAPLYQKQVAAGRKNLAANVVEILMDAAPVVGNIKAYIDGMALLRDADRAETAGNRAEARSLRIAAGVLLASIVAPAVVGTAAKSIRRLRSSADALKRATTPYRLPSRRRRKALVRPPIRLMPARWQAGASAGPRSASRPRPAVV